METTKHPQLRRAWKAAYAKPAAKPRWQREPYSLGIWFDLLVTAALAIAVVGYLTT